MFGRRRPDTKQPPKKDPRQQLCETVAEIAILQAYARSEGKAIPDKTLDGLAQLADWTLAAKTQSEETANVRAAGAGSPPAREPGATQPSEQEPTASAKPSAAPPPTTADGEKKAAPSLGAHLKLALAVHGQLSEVVAPATVRSLKATALDQPFRSWAKQIWVVPLLLVATVLAFVAFVITQAQLAADATATAKATAEAQATATPTPPSGGSPAASLEGERNRA